LILFAAVLSVLAPVSHAQDPGAGQKPYAWSDASLSPDVRADMVLKEMTLDEKISRVHGNGLDFLSTKPAESNGGAGYTVSIPRLGIPAIQMADSAYGVTRGARAGRYSTALPSNLGAASSWDPQTVFAYGALIGRELRSQGYSMSLGGGVNLTREPRNGRTFEYQREDPLLAGTLVGSFIKSVQSQNVVGDVKHYALNDQESGRNAVNVNIDKRSMRESDLLAFQIALEISDPGAVMCSYNRVNGDYACENSYLLTDVLKKDFQFRGFVVSDWGGTHSAAKASHAGSEGLDLKTLDLPEEQNKLIEAVAAANPQTIVVLETGSPATMPWVDKVAGVIEAWYPGIRGAEALASIAEGTVNPSGKLAITFPKSDADLPHPNLVMPPPLSERRFPGPGGNVTEFMSTMAKGLPPFQVYYDEKLKVGYKWYDAENKPVLFPFGFGLSYTSFEYSGLSVSDGNAPGVAFTVKNRGSRSGTEIAEVYCSLPEAAREPPKRLIGWSRVELGPGESKQVSVAVSRDRLAVYDEGSDNWKLVPGSYTFMVGGSSQDLPLRKDIALP